MEERKLINFIRQSNEIENIFREPTIAEIAASKAFLNIKNIGIIDLCAIVTVYQPGAILRDKMGLDVRVGEHSPMKGDPLIRTFLQSILDEMKNYSPFQTHLYYEDLHPFTDGNGRSGRMLWAWQMGSRAFDRDFLHEFYYQTLNEYNE